MIILLRMITRIMNINTGINVFSKNYVIAVIKKLRKDASPGFVVILSNLPI